VRVWSVEGGKEKRGKVERGIFFLARRREGEKEKKDPIEELTGGKCTVKKEKRKEEKVSYTAPVTI